MFSSIVLSLIACFFGFKLIQWLASYVRLCVVVNKIPGPFMVPLFGNVLSFSPSGFIHELVAISKRFSDHSIFRLWIGPHYWLVFHKPEPLEKVFNDSAFSGKAFEYDFLIPWIGKGLIVSKGAKWQNRRRLIAPTFSLDILNDFITVFNDQAKILVDILKENQKIPELNEFDVIPYVSNCTLDILCETVMGININAQGSKHSKYVDAVLKIGPVLFQRPVNPLYWPNFIWERSPLGKEYNEHLKNLHEFTEKVIKERDSEYETEVSGNKKKKIAFLDLLLKVKREQNLIDLEGIKEEVDTFMFAGHDTSANTLSWAIYLIGSHPNVQEKLRNEVDNLFGNSNRHLTNQDLNELKYLEYVILESLRLFPPAPFLGRSISEDCEIDGYKIPKGGTAIILTYMLHRDERYFPNPDEFIPERFASPSLKEKLPEYSFIPFSAGPRFCIGKKFALFSIKIILAHLIRNFHIESANKAGELKGAMDLLLRPERGVFIRLKERF